MAVPHTDLAGSERLMMTAKKKQRAQEPEEVLDEDEVGEVQLSEYLMLLFAVDVFARHVEDTTLVPANDDHTMRGIRLLQQQISDMPTRSRATFSRSYQTRRRRPWWPAPSIKTTRCWVRLVPGRVRVCVGRQSARTATRPGPGTRRRRRTSPAGRKTASPWAAARPPPPARPPGPG